MLTTEDLIGFETISLTGRAVYNPINCNTVLTTDTQVIIG